MSEFKLQHIVSQLLETLGGDVQPEGLVEFLQKDIAKNEVGGSSGVQAVEPSHIQDLIDKCPNDNSGPFLTKYNDLKQKNVDSLNSYVRLLHHITNDSGTKDLLLKNKKQGLVISQSKNVTKDTLGMVKNALKENIKNTPSRATSQLSSNLNTSSTVPMPTAPSVSSWVQRRPVMSFDFSTHNFGKSIATVPDISQENILVEDLLNVLIGLPGCYIEPEELKDKYGPRTFRINDNVPVALQELVNLILPTASHFSIIQRFVEEKMLFEYGQVNNALAEAFQGLIKEHMLFTIQLESEFRSGNLSLQKFWYFTQKNMHFLSVAADIAFSVSKSDAKGGKVLSLLHDSVIGSIGDEKTQQLCLKLMEAASVPYMKMLSRWIYMGIISDPINEFLIEDNEIVQREEMPVDYSADYWDKKYSIRRDRIPKFLEPVADIILKAGKYLNVIRQCGKSVNTKVYPLQYKIEGKHLLEEIEKAYKSASQTLLDLVIKEEDLIGRLRSVKHYFLLDQGDFIVTFLTLCEKELNKKAVDVVQGRLESLMDLALRLSSAVNDPYKEDLRTELLPFNLQFQMFKILSIQTDSEREYWSKFDPKTLSVIESFAFCYEVRWPLSLILNKKSLFCYQMIFRHLFYSKHVERMICQVWKSNKVAKKFDQYWSKFDPKTLSVIESFAFCYEVRWPLSLILNKKSLFCYQMIFRHLFYSKHVERMICQVWKSNKVAKKFDREHARHYREAFALRQKMLHCIQNLEYHMMVEVIEPHWCTFLQKIGKVQNVDEILACHCDFLNNCLKDCMLTIPAILSTVVGLLGICVDFCKFMQNEASLSTSVQGDEPDLSFTDKISKYDLLFTKSVRTLLAQINDLNRDTSEHDRLFNLLYRLNFNSFYTEGKFFKNTSG